MKSHNNSAHKYAMSYLDLRKAIGVLGMTLPFVLALGHIMLFDKEGVQPSLSSYYYTGMGDVFVAVLCIVGAFLFTYKGYEPVDDRAGDLAGLSVVGVALFPPFPDCAVEDLERVCRGMTTDMDKYISYVHFGSATLFFLTVAYISWFLFTKTCETEKPTQRKEQRNCIYRGCALFIILSILAIAVYLWLNDNPSIGVLKPVFWLEVIAVFFFGVSWLTKGEWLLREFKK